MLSRIDFHAPKSWIGRDLPWQLSAQYSQIKNLIKTFIRNRQVNHELMLQIVDKVNAVCGLDISPSMKILTEIISYLRIQLLANTEEIVSLTAVLIDSLVKNCGTRVHILFSHKYFMYTMSKLARRWQARNTHTSKQVANILLDIIQGWGEGFESRHQLYPHIGETYHKLRFKHAMTFPRPQYDPRRVPIFLPPLTEQESQYLHQQQHASEESQDMHCDSVDLLDLTDYPPVDIFASPTLIPKKMDASQSLYPTPSPQQGASQHRNVTSPVNITSELSRSAEYSSTPSYCSLPTPPPPAPIPHNHSHHPTTQFPLHSPSPPPVPSVKQEGTWDLIPPFPPLHDAFDPFPITPSPPADHIPPPPPRPRQPHFTSAPASWTPEHGNETVLRSIIQHPIAVRRRQTEIVTTIDTPYRHPAISGYKYDGPMMASDMANRVQYFGTQRVVQHAKPSEKKH